VIDANCSDNMAAYAFSISTEWESDKEKSVLTVFALLQVMPRQTLRRLTKSEKTATVVLKT
jgi:hypothetical protein